MFFVILLSQVFNLLSCVYVKKFVIFKLHFGRSIFLFILPCFHPEHVFKEKEPLKNKIVANSTKEEKMKMFVETIQ